MNAFPLPPNLKVIKINEYYKNIIFKQMNLNNIKFKIEYYEVNDD